MQLKGFFSQMHQYIRLLTLSLITVIAVIGLTVAPSMALSSQASGITVYRDPSCSCCGSWIKHLAVQGFQAKEVATANMNTLKQKYGVPSDLESCHTAVIGGYLIEGHVPIHDIKRLLAQNPKVVGISVPGMPIGTPGMEDGNRREPFTIFSFDQQENIRVFNKYTF